MRTMGITFAGSWRRLINHRLRNLGNSEYTMVKRILRKMGFMFIQRVKANVRTNRFGYPPKKLLLGGNMNNQEFLAYYKRIGNLSRFLKRFAGVGTPTIMRMRPLMETEELINSLSVVDVPSPFDNPTVFAGITHTTQHLTGAINPFRGSPLKSGYKIAAIMHGGVSSYERISSGFSIKVTDGMRAHFRKAGYNIKDTTTTIVIPPRPFITDTATKDKAFMQLLSYHFLGKFEKLWVNYWNVFSV